MFGRKERALPGNLTLLQARALKAIAAVSPAGVLTGGAALVGFHLKHRFTRNLDFFWYGRSTLDDLSKKAKVALEQAGLTVETLQTSPAFVRVSARSEGESVVIDLVAESVPRVSDPELVSFDGVSVSVDSGFEILVNKLGTLVQRQEIRDLQDVQALLEAESLEDALALAPNKDAGFSPLVLAWSLGSFPVSALGNDAGMDPKEIESLDGFKADLIARVLAFAG